MKQNLKNPELNQIFAELLDIEPAGRDAYLNRVCGSDQNLRDTLDRLLVASEITDDGLVAGGAFNHELFALVDSGEYDETLQPDSRIGAYRISGVIGRGGMATVYLAERADGVYEQQVALKLLRRGLNFAELRQRFDQERQILAALDHPNVARLLDGGVTDAGVPYLVMEHIIGAPLIEYCDGHALNVKQRLRLFIKIARAIDHSHRNLILHRDIKPSNILVTPTGEPKLLDFGIAKLMEQSALANSAPETRAALQPMTPEYASPEQVRGELMTTATDIYQLGGLLYRVLTGLSAHGVSNQAQADLLSTILNKNPLSPSKAVEAEDDAESSALEQSAQRPESRDRLAAKLRGDLDTIVLKTLSKEPGRRYATTRELIDDLERHLAKEPIRARADSVSYRLGRFIARNAIGVATAVGVSVFAISLTIFHTSRLAQARDQAVREVARTEQVSKFLTEIFSNSDPQNSRGEIISAIDILDDGARRIDTDLEEQPDIQATMLLKIGDIYKERGLFDKAESLIERSLVSRRHLYGNYHADTLDSMNSLADVYWRQGRYPDAEKLHKEAYDAARTLLGESDERTLRYLTAVGLAIWRQSRFEEAEKIHGEVVAWRRKIEQPDSPLLASALNNLGGVYLMQGRLEDAATHYTEALEVSRSSRGADHPKTLDALNNLAMTRDQQGQHEIAETLLKEVVELRIRVLGEVHPRTLRSKNNLADLYLNTGRFDLAAKIFKQTLDERRRVLGNDHLDTFWSVENLAIVYQRLGKFDAAAPLFAEALAGRRRVLGDSHVDTLKSIWGIAKFNEASGDLDKAVTHYRSALAGYSRTFGDDHYNAVHARLDLGRTLVLQEKLDEAHEELARSIELTNSEKMQKIIVTGLAHGEFAQCLALQGLTNEADKHFVRSLALLDAAVLEGNSEALPILSYAAEFYEDTGEVQRAQELRQQLSKLEK